MSRASLGLPKDCRGLTPVRLPNSPITRPGRHMHVQLRPLFVGTAIATCLIASTTHAQTLIQPGWHVMPMRSDQADVVVCMSPKPTSTDVTGWEATIGMLPPKCPGWFRANVRERSVALGLSSRLTDAQVVQAINESGVLHELELQAQAKDAVLKARNLQEYHDRFQRAVTAYQINAFARDYGSNDAEDLINQAWNRFAAKERIDFAAAKTVSGLQQFILTYKEADRAGLVDAATEKLEAARRSQGSVDNVSNLANAIRSCRRQIGLAEKTIDREKQIASVSGTQNLSLLHQAGDTIVSCRQAIPNIYASYRKAGGGLALEAIR